MWVADEEGDSLFELAEDQPQLDYGVVD